MASIMPLVTPEDLARLGKIPPPPPLPGPTAFSTAPTVAPTNTTAAPPPVDTVNETNWGSAGTSPLTKVAATGGSPAGTLVGPEPIPLTTPKTVINVRPFVPPVMETIEPPKPTVIEAPKFNAPVMETIKPPEPTVIEAPKFNAPVMETIEPPNPNAAGAGGPTDPYMANKVAPENDPHNPAYVEGPGKPPAAWNQPTTNGPPLVPPGKGTGFTDDLTAYDDQFKAWAKGVEDPVYRTMANKLITQFSLSNQAERDAMQMRINQDPNLAGQGAGMAMLGVLARDQNFSQDQVFANLSIENQKNILDMQKYGIEGAIKVSTIRRARQSEDINNALAAGDFHGAANLLQDQIDRDHPGSGITIDPQMLSLRDPTNIKAVADAAAIAETIRQEAVAAGVIEKADKADAAKLKAADDRKIALQNKSDIAALSVKDPAKAIALAKKLMASNPDLFIEGESAEDFVTRSANDIKKDEYDLQQALSNYKDILKLIPTFPNEAKAMLETWLADPANASLHTPGMTADMVIKANEPAAIAARVQAIAPLQEAVNTVVASKTGTYDDIAEGMKSLFAAQGKDGAALGRGMSIDQINEALTATGGKAITADDLKTWVNDDYADAAYRAKFASLKKDGIENPWDAKLKLLLSTIDGAKFADPLLNPAGRSAIEDWLKIESLSPHVGEPDPITGIRQVISTPWEDPTLSPIFFDWPMATWNEKGVLDPVYYKGGMAYGEPLYDASGNPMVDKDGKPMKVTATPKDRALDAQYAAYKRDAGPLTANEWYFATKGGTVEPDSKNMLGSVSGGEDTPVSNADLDSILKTFDTDFPKMSPKVDSDATKEAITNIAKDPVYTDMKMLQVLLRQPQWRDIQENIGYKGYDKLPIKDATSFITLINQGLSEAEAAKIMVSLTSQDRFNAAYKAIKGKDWAA